MPTEGPVIPSPLSMTDCSGSIQKAQIVAPMNSSPADTPNGATQDPLDTRYPNTVGESAPTNWPPMFIMPDTVPENSPPMSMGTAHAGPMVISRKNIAIVRKMSALKGLADKAANIVDVPHPSMAVMATERRENLRLFVFRNNLSVSQPPKASPTTPAASGMEA